MDGQTLIKVKFAFRKIHVLICFVTILTFSVVIGKDIVVDLMTNSLNIQSLIPSLLTLTFFSALLLLFLWINAWMHKSIEKQLLHYVIQLFECEIK